MVMMMRAISSSAFETWLEVDAQERCFLLRLRLRLRRRFFRRRRRRRRRHRASEIEEVSRQNVGEKTPRNDSDDDDCTVFFEIYVVVVYVVEKERGAKSDAHGKTSRVVFAARSEPS